MSPLPPSLRNWAKLTYALPAWWGYTSETQKRRRHRLLIKLQRCGFLHAQFDSKADLCSAADDALFRSILSNENHVLHLWLPSIKSTGYDLRTRAHSRIIPRADARMRRNFIFRMLYHDIFLVTRNILLANSMHIPSIQFDELYPFSYTYKMKLCIYIYFLFVTINIKHCDIVADIT